MNGATIDLNTLLVVFGLLANAALVVRFFVKIERRFTRIETVLHVHFNGKNHVFNSDGNDSHD